MRKLVFEADIIVPHLELHRHRYEVTAETLNNLLATLQPSDNELGITAAELDDLLCDSGMAANVVRLSGRQDAVRKLLAAVSKAAWENDIPWTLDQAEGFGIGDARFHQYVAAYVMPDKDHPLGVQE